MDTVQWSPWDKEAFVKSQNENKPIFLSISATWCHWCHVMDHESFTHPEIIRKINTSYIPVRVDSDKRPDLNNRYNMGGWPTVAILNSRGKVLTGSTYLPPHQLLAMLDSIPVGDAQILEKTTAPVVPKTGDEIRTAGNLDETPIKNVIEYLEKSFDPHFGGFGGPPKFPPIYALEFALHIFSKTGDPKWKEIVTLTLDNMRGAGIYDHIDGGFFRYATRGDWDNPHFEKILEVNARLLCIYLKAYHISGDATYRVTAQGILDYFFTTLEKEGTPWFCGSQASDTTYYQLPEEERNWETPPPRDPTLYTDRNALTASGLFHAYHILDQEAYLNKALSLIDFLWEAGQGPTGGFYHFKNGEGGLSGFLSDQVEMLNALLDGLEATGNHMYLTRGENVASWMAQHLWDHPQGGFWDLPEGQGKTEANHVRIKPFVENASAAMAFLRLYHLTQKEVYRKQAETVLINLLNEYKNFQHHSALFALALDRYLHPPHVVNIVGKPGDPNWSKLLKAAHQMKPLWRVIHPMDVDQNTEEMRKFGYSSAETATAYLCIGKICSPPIFHPRDLSENKFSA